VQNPRVESCAKWRAADPHKKKRHRGQSNGVSKAKPKICIPLIGARHPGRKLNPRRLAKGSQLLTLVIDDIVRVAINLATNTGFAVFPCMSAKTPFKGSRGYKDATKVPSEIEALWRRFPGPLIAVATGEVSGVDVLDVDVRHSVACRWWRGNCHRIPRTRTYRTRGGGLHLYLRHAPGVRNSQDTRIAHGVDVRADGGSAAFWFAHGYECLDDSPPAAWPDWLLRLARPPRRPVQPPPARAYDGPDKGVPALLAKVATAPEGQRNGILHWASCRFAERVRLGRVSVREAEGELIRAALQAGLPEHEARRTIASGLRGAL
jgi:hypothetical protein